MLNPASPIPLYRQLAELLSMQIRAGEPATGEKIASEHELANHYGIGRPTVRQATDLLVRQQLLERRRGAGTFVCEPRQPVDLFSLAGTLSAFERSGYQIETRLLGPVLLLVLNNEAAGSLNGREVYKIERLSSHLGNALLLEHIYLRTDVFADFDRIDISGRSISQLAAEEYYLTASSAKQSFRAIRTSKNMADIFAVSAGSPLLKVSRRVDFEHVTDGVYAELFCHTTEMAFSQTIGAPSVAENDTNDTPSATQPSAGADSK